MCINKLPTSYMFHVHDCCMGVQKTGSKPLGMELHIIMEHHKISVLDIELWSSEVAASTVNRWATTTASWPFSFERKSYNAWICYFQHHFRKPPRDNPIQVFIEFENIWVLREDGEINKAVENVEHNMQSILLRPWVS